MECAKIIFTLKSVAAEKGGSGGLSPRIKLTNFLVFNIVEGGQKFGKNQRKVIKIISV